MKTMYKGLVNSPETTITNNIGTNDTIIYVLDPTRVPSDLPNLMVLGTGTNAETIKVTAIEGNALTVERGFQGIAKDWLAGTIIARNFTEYDYAALVDNINELELTKETPDGAQAKADTAEGNAKTYASGLIGVLSNLKTTVKDKIVSAINELFDNFASHLADYASMQFGSIPYTTTQDVTYYIDEVNGDDDNDGLTPGTAFKTWAKTKSVIPLICFHTVTIRIIGNLNETISISNRLCKSLNRINVRGDTTTPGDHQINGIRAYTGMGIRFQYLRINGLVDLRDSVNIDVRNCEPRNPGGNGIEVRHGIYYIAANDFGNDVVEDAIYAANSRVYSAMNIGNATRYGLNATVASTIGKYDTQQPTGTEANERIGTGGVIR